jgi:hypothetical protein
MYWIYDMPTWQMGLLFVAFFLITSLSGLFLLRSWIYTKFHITNDTNDSVNGIFAGIGVLFGLLLGLVAVAVWENYNSVDSLSGKEASAVATLYRDVSTLQEPARTKLELNLKNYLTYVIYTAWPAHQQGEKPKGDGIILPLLQTSCRLKFLKKIKFEIKDEIIYKVFCRLQRASSNKSL